MLKIKTYIDKSDIEGIGLFAGEDISAGKQIAEINYRIDRWLSDVELKSMPEIIQSVFHHYGYKDGSTYYLNADNMRFMNHSKDPNTYSDAMGHDYALKDIKNGDELTCDYFSFDDLAEDKLK